MSAATLARIARTQAFRELEAEEAAGRLRQYKKLLKKRQDDARRGDVEAHFWLGRAHADERHNLFHLLPSDVEKAFYHLRAAAAGNHAAAHLQMAWMRVGRSGHVSPNELALAVELTVRAAELGLSAARDVLEKYFSLQLGLADLLRHAIDFDGGTTKWPGGVVDSLIQKYRLTHRRESAMNLPGSGEALHPRTNFNYRLERTQWFGGDAVPEYEGIYERDNNGKIIFSFWNRQYWTGTSRSAEELADNLTDSILARARQQCLPWRGLANNPSTIYDTFVNPPGPMLSGVEIKGYVEQFELGVAKVRDIHVAQAWLSRDGDYLTVCGYKAPIGRHLRLWCEGVKIKTVDGHPPKLCDTCARRTFAQA